MPSVLRAMLLGATSLMAKTATEATIRLIARKISQVGLQAFNRVSDTDRRRVSDGVVPTLIKRPNPKTYRFRFIQAAMMDWLLYDNSYIWVRSDITRADCPWSMWHLKSQWVTGVYGGDFVTGSAGIVVNVPNMPRQIRVPFEQLIHLHGYNPGRVDTGVTPIDALKGTLAEQIASNDYRLKRWQKGPQISGYLARPATAPRWSPDAKEKFRADWKAMYSGRDGDDAHGTPILEDGMTYGQLGWSAADDQYVEGSKLSRVTVAAAYYLNPIFVGYLDNASYSNTVVFKTMLYGETLGPSFEDLAGAFTTQLLPIVKADPSTYLEFNVEAFLQGSFAEQAQVVSTSVGGPWLTRNEARAMFNRPPVAGGDDLIVPLNVTAGGQASPQTPIGGGQALSAITRPDHPSLALKPGQKTGSTRGKSAPTDQDRADAELTLVVFFERQKTSVLNAIERGDTTWFDTARWDRELTDDLTALGLDLAERYGQELMDDLATDITFDVGVMHNYVATIMENRAELINQATNRQLVDVVAAGDPDVLPVSVFELAIATRAAAAGLSLTTTVAGVSTQVAAEVAFGGEGTKTWHTTSKKPRPEHARMNGQTVPVADAFVNGAMWPGDASLGVDGIAGCKCVITINRP